MQPEQQILEAARQFTNSRVILTAAELDLFTRLDPEPATAGTLAAAVAADARALSRLLDALVVLHLLEKDRDRYRLTAEGRFLSAGRPGSVLPMVLHMNTIWRNWSDLTACVKNGRNPRLEPVVDTMNEEERKAFIGAMHVAGRALAQEIAAEVDLTSRRRLLDIGGGSGTYTIAFLERNPDLEAVLFDLEAVIPMAEERLRGEGLLDRADLQPGDFYEDELPKGCDAALLSAIIHQNGPEQNLALYRKILTALEPGGVLIIRDHIMDPSRTRPPAGVLFALNMLVNTPGGDTYTFAEVKEHLEKAGFEKVRQMKSGERMDGIVEAFKPKS
jgi:predicted O-methyltransferase YrrM